MIAFLKSLGLRLLALAKSLYAREPALLLTGLVAAIVAVAGQLGIVLDQQSLGQTVAEIVPILLGGTAIRQSVIAPANRYGKGRARL